jgi:hypothetical protein
MANNITAVVRNVNAEANWTAEEKESVLGILKDYNDDGKNGLIRPYYTKYKQYRNPARIKNQRWGFDLTASEKAISELEPRTPIGLPRNMNRMNPKLRETLQKAVANGNENVIFQGLAQNFTTLTTDEKKRALVALRRYIGPVRFQRFVKSLDVRTNTSLFGTLVKNARAEANRSFPKQRPGSQFRKIDEGARNLVRRIGSVPRSSKWMQQNASNTRGFREYEIIEAQVLRTPGDGNCLFHSIAQHLYRMRNGRYAEYTKPRDKHILDTMMMRLRKDMSEYVIAPPTPTNAKEVLKSLYTETGQLLAPQQYSQHILRPGTYGGEPDMIVLSRIYKFPIILYKRVDSTIPFKAPAMDGIFKRYYIIGEEFKKPPLFLLYTPGSGARSELGAHYDVLYRVGDHTPRPTAPMSPTRRTNGGRLPPPPRPGGTAGASANVFPSFTATTENETMGAMWIVAALCSVSSVFSAISR